ncbi:MAG: hypothetical protein HY904_10685 [Deltaproteobacteria bacterium]|nr:hypothetical protein [Deltaproteobacteria bacterium]
MTETTLTSPGLAPGVLPAPRADGGALRPAGGWLLVFRVASALVLLVGGAAIHLRAPSSVQMPSAALFYGSLAGAFILSLVIATWLRARPRAAPGVLGDLQLLTDLVVTTLVVYATGGQDSLLTFLYPLNTLFAAALVSRPAGYGVAATGAATYAVMVALMVVGILPRPDEPGVPFDREAVSVLTATVGANVLVAMLGGQLSEQVRASGERLDRARTDLAALQSLNTAVVTSLPSGLLSVNRAGLVQALNPAALATLGITAPAAEGLSVGRLLPELGAMPWDGRELRYQHPDGRVRQLAVAATPLQGDAAAGGAVVVIQDVTEQRRLEAAVARSERLATVGQFAAGLAHELRNPLGSMIGCVELLQQGASQDGDQARLLSIIHREAERLAGLVHAFLLYARPQPPQPERLDAAALLREVAEDFERDPGCGVCVQVDAPDTLPLRADGAQLRGVLWNLLRNAAEASPQGGTLRLRAEPATLRAAEAVTFTVRDDGPGVPPEDAAKLFEPFFTTRPGGTGLGLAIVHRVVEAHGGLVGLQQAGGPGAVFYVTLPAQPPAPAPEPPGAPAGEGAH